jgi:hypothetical protein
MKKIILALLVSVPCMAQKMAVNAVDPATGGKILLTESVEGNPPKNDESVVNNGLVFFSAGYQDVPAGNGLQGLYFISLNIVHHDKRVGCLTQEKGRVLLTLEDGTEINCSQISATDCDPIGFTTDFMLVKKGGSVAEMKQNFEKLQHTMIKRITIITTETAIKYGVKPAKRMLLAKHFGLVAESLKK